MATALLGVRYLLLPDTMRPLVPAKWIATRQVYSLWQVDGVGYARIVDTVGSLQLNRADIGPKSRDYMASVLPALGLYLTVGYEGGRAAPPTAPDPRCREDRHHKAGGHKTADHKAGDHKIAGERSEVGGHAESGRPE